MHPSCDYSDEPYLHRMKLLYNSDEALDQRPARSEDVYLAECPS